MPPKTNAKYIEVRALRDSLINQLRETLEIAQLAQNDPTRGFIFKRRFQNVNDIYSKLQTIHESVIAHLSSQNEPDFKSEDEIRKNYDAIYYEVCAVYEQMYPFDCETRNATPALSEDNYIIAYQILIDRYDNKRRLATHYWHKIHSLTSLKEESPKGLRELFDNFRENLAALRALKIADSLEDFILLNILLEKLDPSTRRLFESEIRDLKQAIPTFQTLENFIEGQCRVLDTVKNSQPTQRYNPKFQNNKEPKRIFHVTSNQVSSNKCFICYKEHSTYSCPELSEKTPQQRFELVSSKKLCVNCLSGLHHTRECKSKVNCRKCHKFHHTLLHFGKFNPQHERIVESGTISQSLPQSSSEYCAVNNPEHSVAALVSSASNKLVLLSTVLLDIRDSMGHPHTIRAILDGGSEASFITSGCVQRLGLRVKNNNRVQVQGIGSSTTLASSGVVNCCIYPRDEIQPSHLIEAHVIPCISRNIPAAPVDVSTWTHIKTLRLADAQFHIPSRVDLLLGADIFAQLLRPGVLVGPPAAMNTIFGWVLSGQAQVDNSSSVNSFLVSRSQQSLDSTLTKFWEIEEMSGPIPPSHDDIICEKLFTSSVDRDPTGRYTVALPFKTHNPEFPNFRSVALRRFHLLENRFSRDESLRKAYLEFMKDYLETGHMSLANDSVLSNEAYYIPHHCVFKVENNSRKIRVVFDASAKASNEESLNDSLYAGPKLLPNIGNVLLKFRAHTVVFVADVKQMYRQIRIAPSHRDFQRILWRFSEHDSIQEYTLNTVTYGVSASPFLAIRTLHQLAQDEQLNFPLASAVLKEDVYVDDVVSGCNSLQEARDVQDQLIKLLECGGFLLRKWSSNVPELLSNLDSSLCQDGLSFDGDSESTVKILGLQWFPSLNVFSFKVDPIERICTKRHILSEIARVFDPLGFLSALTFFSKRLIQHLWCLGLDWDATPPNDVVDRWNEYRNQLSLITTIRIDRHLLTQNHLSVELHAFCDASEAGYAAVVYFRVVDHSNNVSVKFVTAKTKVAPLKKRPLPQLELCGAYLLSNVVSSVMTIYSNQISQVVAWSDSTIVLAWLHSSPHRWKTFVSNRVSHIQERVPPSSWRHIRSEDNPADCASRGLLPRELLNHPLWWTGPAWLTQSPESWPTLKLDYSEAHDEVSREERTISVFVAHVDNLVEPWNHLLQKYSLLSKILRVVVYCLRFINGLRNRATHVVGVCTSSELHEALLTLVKQVQRQTFHEAIESLTLNKPLPKSLRKLSPFLDERGILRVGGRLRNSLLSFEEKHPALLPQSHRLTTLIIEDVHNKNLHPGPRTLDYLIRQNFWILSSQRAIRRSLSNCLKCFRVKPKSLQPPMGDLPALRVQQIKAFHSVGIDFGGPYTITMGRIRGAKTYKAYICLFVCLATKALHLELVSNLSTDAFLAALRRFIARRGRCGIIISDCGTNFVGAARTLSTYFKAAVDQEGITWKFNPPSAPHFGGIWEAGIKSVKTHLMRVIGEQILTFEEFSTVLAQIEATLNSRPLCPLSSDPNDLEVLTPGHYLTLAPLTCIPDPDYTGINSNRVTRWQLLQKMHQHFWKRWHHEYLHTLQQRSKWTSASIQLQPGSLVVIKDDLSPPLRWRLGRVIQLHPDAQGISRVATIKTIQGTFKGPVVKLCPLPNH